jgi:hypothetical protein
VLSLSLDDCLINDCLYRFADVDLQNDKQSFPFTIVEGPDGGILVELMYEKVILSHIHRKHFNSLITE